MTLRSALAEGGQLDDYQFSMQISICPSKTKTKPINQ